MKLIPLTQGKSAKVDDEDFDFLNQWKWRAHKNGNTYYAIRSKKAIKMHRVLLNVTDRKILVDHKDCDGLNNTKENLRFANFAQNSQNRKYLRKHSSKYTGVYWFKRDAKWKASIKKNGKSFHLGMFESEEAAALKYNETARLFFGEYATQNKIETPQK